MLLLVDEACADEDEVVDDEVVEADDVVVIGGDCGGNVLKSSVLLSSELCDAALFRIFKNSSNSMEPFSGFFLI